MRGTLSVGMLQLKYSMDVFVVQYMHSGVKQKNNNPYSFMQNDALPTRPSGEMTGIFAALLMHQ